jgi:hypothetical protein
MKQLSEFLSTNAKIKYIPQVPIAKSELISILNNNDYNDVKHIKSEIQYNIIEYLIRNYENQKVYYIHYGGATIDEAHKIYDCYVYNGYELSKNNPIIVFTICDDNRDLSSRYYIGRLVWREDNNIENVKMERYTNYSEFQTQINKFFNL